MAASGKELTEEQWKEIEEFTAKALPRFHECISTCTYALNRKESRLCILLRLYVKPKAASFLLGVSPSYITKQGKSVLKRIYKVDGSAKDLGKRLIQLC